MSAPSPAPANNAPAPADDPFPASAQWTLALILGLVLLLIAWRAWSDRLGTRPTEIQPHRTDVNRASRSDLLQLPGVGPNTADALLSHRDASGGFTSGDELRKVKGVGPKKQTQMRPWINFQDEAISKDEPEKLSRQPAPTVAEPPAPSRAQKAIPESRININEASLAELQKLPGIGPAMSQRIADERKKKAFEKVDDLRRVSGIGVKTLEKLRPYVAVGDEN